MKLKIDWKKYCLLLVLSFVFMLKTTDVKADDYNEVWTDVQLNGEFDFLGYENYWDDDWEFHEINHFYKFTLDNESRIDFSVNWSGEDNSTSLEIYSFTDKDESGKNKSVYYISGKHGVETKESVVLKKGTYYIEPWNSSSGKCTLNTTPTNYAKNYSRKKASNLKMNQKVDLYASKTNNYKYWYKIELTKKQRIEIYAKNSSSFYWDSVRIYDVKNKQFIDTNYNESKKCFYPSSKLEKGTYYFYYKFNDFDSNGYVGRYIQLYWK